MTALAESLPEQRLLIDLEPVVEREVNRHMSTAKEWFPHEYVPWSEGEDFSGPLGGREWSPDDLRFSDAARTSLIINLLTEDNLPSYHLEIASVMGRDGAWGTWVGRWTAEEGRHSVAIRDYLTVTRTVDPVALERARMSHMEAGFQAIHPGLLAGLSYVSFQELATRVSHRNTGAATGDPVAEQLFARIALDENLHMIFYRNVIEAAFELAPDQTMAAVTATVRDFAMPGHGMEGFSRAAVAIAVEGIYDVRQHRDEVLMPVLRKWRVFERADFGAAGEQSREELATMLDDMQAAAVRFEEKRDALKARLAARV
ncbi:MAG: acyl-ACP desaturase [Actinomycetota bacterium]|nr:acyl-ACP desaturase [Actinomycetota bacterium]